MKKLLLLILMLVAVVMTYAQHNCPFNVEFTTQDANCFNNGKVTFTVYDDDHNPVDLATLVSTTDIMQVRGYWKRNDGADTNHYVPDNVNEMTVEPGNYIVGVQAVCSDSIILDRHQEVTVGSTYVIPSASPLTNFASSKAGYGNRYSTRCADLGRIQLKIEGGVMPYTIVMVNATTGETLSTKVFTAPMYTGTDSTAYNYWKYYTYDSLAIGSYHFYMSDACGYGLPRIAETVHNVAPPTVNGNFKHIDNVDYTATATSLDKAFFPSDTVLQMRMYLDGLVPYLSDVYKDALSYRISYSAASGLRATDWRPFPYSSGQNWAVVSDTLHSGNYSPLLGNKVTLSIRYQCGDSLVRTKDFEFQKPGTGSFDARKSDIFDSVYQVHPPCASEYYMHTDYYSIQYNSNWIRPFNEMKPIVWVYTNTADNDVIKRDTLSDNNIRALSKITADDIIAHFGVFDSLHQYPMNVERKLVNRYGTVLYSRVDSLKFVVDKGVEQVEWEAVRAAGSGNCGANNSITLKEKYAATTNQNQNVIRLIQSPYGNYFNFTATYDSVTGRWRVEPEDLQDITGVEVFKGTGPRKLYIQGSLPSGRYVFKIQTQCGTYTVNQKLSFNDQYDVRLTQEFKYTKVQHCSDLYLKPQQGRFILYHINGVGEGERQETYGSGDVYRSFQIINGPRGGYETRAITTDSHDSLRITMPGTYVIRMGRTDYNSYCGKSAYKLDTVVFENRMIDFDYARAILCNEGDTVGTVHVKGMNGTAPFTYTLYSGPDLTGVRLGSNQTGEFENVPFTMGSTLSCQVRDNCGAFFSVDITPSQRENIKGAWFEGLKLKDTKCEGDSVTLHAFKEGHFDYSWTGPNGFTCSSADTTFALKRNDQGGWYKVSIQMGCPVPITDSIQLAVLRSPTLAIAKDTTICPGMEVALQLTPSSDSTNALINYKVAVLENGDLQVHSFSTQCDSTEELRINPMYPTKVYSALIDDGTCVYKIADDTVTVITRTDVISACDIVAEGDRVCYNTEAEVRAKSTLMLPYVLKWYSDYELTTLLQTDSMQTTDWSVYYTDKLKDNRTLYVAVEKEGMCPYVNGIPSSTVLMSDGANTHLTCDQTMRFFDDGGVAGNYVVHAGQRITHMFECAPGYHVTLNFDELDIASTASLKIYSGDAVNTDSLMRTLRQGADLSKAFTSKGNKLMVEFITGGGLSRRGWDARVGVAAVADVDVILRAPRLALATTNDSVCYDYTAHLTASSDLTYPQYYEWWDSKLSSILLRDTVQAAGEVSHFRPEHQIKDSLYYINVYDADNCPLDTTYFNVHRTERPEVRLSSTTSGVNVRTTVLQPYDYVPFYDNGGKTGMYSWQNNTANTNTTYYQVFKAEEGQVVLHFDTISIYNNNGYLLKIYDGTSNTAENLAQLKGNYRDLTYRSSSGSIYVEYKSYAGYRGWEGYVTTDRAYADLSSAEVTIRKPYGSDGVITTHDTVCYDNSAYLTATSSLDYPQYFQWWSSDKQTLLLQDTVQSGNVSHYNPAHQKRDQKYYVSVYNEENCPQDLRYSWYGRIIKPEFKMHVNGTYNTLDTIRLGFNDSIPFFDCGGIYGTARETTTGYARYLIVAPEGGQVVLHIDTLGLDDIENYGLRIYDDVNTTESKRLATLYGSMTDTTIVSTNGCLLLYYYENSISANSRYWGWKGGITTDFNGNEELVSANVRIRRLSDQSVAVTTNDTVCFDETAHLTAEVATSSVGLPQYYTWWNELQTKVLHQETITADGEISSFNPEHQQKDADYYVSVHTDGQCPYTAEQRYLDFTVLPDLCLNSTTPSYLYASYYDLKPNELIPFYDGGGPNDTIGGTGSGGRIGSAAIIHAPEGYRIVLHIDTMSLYVTSQAALAGLNVFDTARPVYTRRVAYFSGNLSDTTLIIDAENIFVTCRNNYSVGSMGWKGYITTDKIVDNMAKASVKIHHPLDAAYVTSTHDTVCYDNTAVLTATSNIGYPQYFTWWDDKGTTLLHRDTVHNATEYAEWKPEHQIKDSLYFVHVYNDTTCPYRTDGYLISNQREYETIMNTKSVDTVHVKYGDRIWFYDEGGKNGYTHVTDTFFKLFIAEPGKQIHLHFDTVKTGSYTYIYDGTTRSAKVLHSFTTASASQRDLDFYSASGAILVCTYVASNTYGFAGYVEILGTKPMDLAESRVKIRKPLTANYFTPINDTVCYDYTATLSATSPIGFPQYFEWFKNDAQTLLHRDTAYMTSDIAKFNPEHQITDSLYYVHVYNDTTCPYLPDQYGRLQFHTTGGETLLDRLEANYDTVDVACGEWISFYDNGGKNGNTTGANYSYYKKVFRAEPGKQVVLHIDTLSLANNSSYGLNVYEGNNTASSLLLANLYGTKHDTTITSTTGMLTVRWYKYNSFMGWEGYVTTDCDTAAMLAETSVSIRKPLLASYVTPKNDTVCYDNTATLSATSPIGFPQYFEWFKNDAQTLLYRDTAFTASDMAKFNPEHQIKDSLYYVHVYNDTTCPYLPDLYRTEQFIETRPATLLNQLDATTDTVDIVCGEIYPFYDNGGKNGNMTGTYQYYRKVFRAEPGKQVILHIDTLSVINNASYALRVYDGTTTSKQIAVLYGPGIHDRTFTSTTGALTVRLFNYLGYMGWEASVTTNCDTGTYLAETTVNIRRPLAAEYVTPKNDTVCYDNTATLSATSPIGFPQYFSWWKDDAVTLLKRDTLNDATELSDYIAEHQITDSLYFVHVYNDTTCPYLPDQHLDFRTLRGETVLDQPDATPDTVDIVCGDMYAFYDNGGKNGNAIGTDGTYYKKVFRAEQGKQVILHIDTLSLYSASYALRIYDGTKNSTASQIAVLYGSIHDTTFTSTTGALTVRFRKYNNYMGWEGTVTTDCNDILAEANVSIRKPLTADYITPKNDTVCYDYTATVTATSSIGFPQYFSWWKDDAVTLLKRDTLNDATELSNYIAEHQIKDSLYYVHVYNDTTCPYLPEVHNEREIMGQTLLNQTTADTVDIACGEMYNFYDKGGKNANTTNSYTRYRKVFRAEPGKQVVLHIDTLSLYGYSYYGLSVYDGTTTSNHITDLYGSGVHDKTITSTKGALFVIYYEYGSHMGWEGTVTTDCNTTLAEADVKIRKPLGTTAVITTNDTVCYDRAATLTATSPSAVYPQYFSWWKDDGHTLLHRDTVNSATEHSEFVAEHQIKDSLYYVVVEDSTSCPFRLDVYPIKPIEQPALSVYEQPDSTVVRVHKGERIPLRNLATSVDGTVHNIIFQADEGEHVVMNVNRLYNPNIDWKEVGIIYDVNVDGSSSEITWMYAGYYDFYGTGNITSSKDRLVLRTFAEASVDDVWDGYVTTTGAMLDVAKAEVSIRKPLGKEAVLATHDTVCYDHTATLTATSPVGYPQYFSWWKKDGQTLLHRDTLHNDTEHSEFIAEHQISDSLYYVVVENDTSCPFRTDIYRASLVAQPEVSIYGVPNDSVIRVHAGDSIPLRNNVLPIGGGTLRFIRFDSDNGQPIRLHVDSLYDPNHNYSEFGQVYSVKDDGSVSNIDYLPYDDTWGTYPRDYISNTGRILLFKNGYSAVDDRIVAYVTAGDLFDAAESKVKIREPLDGKKNAITTNDTVCYDNTAMLTATSALTYPQYYNWWDKSMGTLLMSDTVLAAGDVSAWMPMHQTQDSLYYVTVYDKNTCPLVPGMHNIKEPTPRQPEVLLDPYSTSWVSMDIQAGDTIPFQILDTLSGSYKDYYMYFVNQSEEERLVLHFDTIRIVTGSNDYAYGYLENYDDYNWDQVWGFDVSAASSYTYSNQDIVLPYNKYLNYYMSGCCDTVSILIKGYVTVPEVRYQMASSAVKVIPVPATVTTADVTFCPNVSDTLLTAVFTDVTPTYTAVWMSEGDTLAVHGNIPDTRLTDTLRYTAPAGTVCGETRKYHVICVASTGCETVGDTSLITYAVTEDFTLPADKDSVVACIDRALEPAASLVPTVTDGCGNVLTPTGPVSADSIPSSCEGKRTYTYTYTDCALRSHEWTYTYWIRMPEKLSGVPASDTVTVDYVSQAVAPGAPDITDECGRTISPLYDPATDSVSTIATDGTGTIEHTYHYSDCAGHDSTYTRVYRLSTISTPLRIASGDCTLEYNGLEQTCEVYTVTFDGVTVDECMACRTRGGYTHRYILPATGDTVTIKDAIVVRDVVTDTANTYTAIIGHASRYTDVKLDTGRITVTPLAIGITAADSTKECDGTALTCDRWSLTSGTLGDGDAITSVTVTGSQDGVGTSPNKASDAKIEKGTEDVTHNYTITYNDGQLTVTDTTKPTFTSPKDTMLYKDALCNADTTASSIGSPTNLADNCADASALTVTRTDGNYSSTCAGSYTFERVWRVTDATGNYRETKQTVTVSDTVRPVYERPKDTTVYKNGLCAADTTPAVTGQPTGVKDNCTDTLSLTIVHYDRNITETCAGSYTFERVWRVVDECGNVSAVADSVQTVTVSDTTRPEFEVPADTVICREVATDMVVNPDKAVTGEPSNLSDNCTDAAALQTNTAYTDVDPSTVDHNIVNYIERHWTVTDACGNVTEKVQRIGVFPAIHDGNTPMQCHDTLLTLAYGRCDTAIDLRQPTWSTSVTGAGTIRLSNDAPARFPEGATVVTWTLTDTCGFTVTCQQTVTVSYPPCGRPQDTVLYDGFTYHTVRVGCECWLQENLRNRVYSDGTDVAVYSSYEHSDQNEEDYGLLYTWYSAVRVPEGDNTAVPADSVAPMGEHYVEGACPAGWAVPTDAQYEDLWLNGYGASGLKDKDARYWLPGYAGTDPNSYFNARGAGYYDPVTDRYYNLLGETYFWTGEPTTNYTEGHCAVITSECPELLSKEQPKGRGQSIRCVQKR